MRTGDRVPRVDGAAPMTAAIHEMSRKMMGDHGRRRRQRSASSGVISDGDLRRALEKDPERLTTDRRRLLPAESAHDPGRGIRVGRPWRRWRTQDHVALHRRRRRRRRGRAPHARPPVGRDPLSRCRPRAPAPSRALFLDVDGVLTDGQIYLDGRGHELKVFNTKDGHGMRKAAAAGITVCWISGRRSPATARRARELGVAICYQGVRDKGARIEAVRAPARLSAPGDRRRIGDDEPDIPMFEAAGLSACPADAVPAAKRAADVVLKSPGGHGAVREFIELILRRNGQSGAVTHRPGGSSQSQVACLGLEFAPRP